MNLSDTPFLVQPSILPQLPLYEENLNAPFLGELRKLKSPLFKKGEFQKCCSSLHCLFISY